MSPTQDWPTRFSGVDDAEVASGSVVRLLSSRCDDCGRSEFPAREACPACGGRSAPVHLSPRGELVLHTSVLHAPPGSLVPVPYGIGVVEFDHALRVMGLVEDSAFDLELGATMECVAAAPADDLVTYAFRAV